jgi:plastocyanin
VKVGEKITWTNEDDVEHFVKSDTGDDLFNSGDLAEKQTYSVVIDKPGTYKYHCNIHSSMTGTIVAS